MGKWLGGAAIGCSAGLFLIFIPTITRWVAPAARPNIVLISIDTLRADRLGSYGYRPAATPVLDALAARGRRFERASTVTPLTLPAHTSLLTGLFPTRHGVRDNGGFYVEPKHVTVAERLREQGYATSAFVASFVLDSRWGLDQGFDTYFDDFDLSGGGEAGMDDIQRRASDVVDRALAWLDTTAGRPFFAWVHLYDPHTPYDAPEPYGSLFPATTQGAYDAEIAYTDAQIGRLLDGLAGQGLTDRTIVIVVGDHGESLGEHREQTHGFFIYDATTRIPLIVAGPGVAPGVDASEVRIVDVAPSILQMTGAPPVEGIDGRSLLSTRTPRDKAAYSESFYPRIHYGWSELRSIGDGRYKYIAAPRPELYDLMRDPGETRNLVHDEPRLAESMAAALQIYTDGDDPEATQPAPIDADVQARLQALGYVSAGSARRVHAGTALPDPKDKIDLYVDVKTALLEKRLGKSDEAIGRLRRVLQRDDKMIEGHTLLGSLLLGAGSATTAVTAFQRALALDAEHRGATFNLALAYKQLGQLASAEAGFERLRRLDSRDGKPRWHLADIWMQQGESERAHTLLVESLALPVDQPAFLLKLAECLIEMKRFDEATTPLQAALALRPRLPRAHYDLGLIHEARGDTVAAERAYTQELTFNPSTWAAAYNLGQILARSGRAQEAGERFRQVVAVNPDFAGGYLYLAKSHLDSGDLAAAAAAAVQGLVRRPGPPLEAFGRYLLADVYSRLGRPGDARREAMRARAIEARFVASRTTHE